MAEKTHLASCNQIDLGLRSSHLQGPILGGLCGYDFSDSNSSVQADELFASFVQLLGIVSLAVPADLSLCQYSVVSIC